METYSLNIAYNGSPFSGFARQPGQLTVQGELEGALALIFRDEIEVTCAGRTDAGVHARGQVISFELPDGAMEGREPRRFLRSMNALTHDGIVVTDLRRRSDAFSARFDARSREYRYFLHPSDVPAIFMEDFSWTVDAALDADAMRAGAAHLIGEHDFKSFCMAASAEGRRTYRCVNEITLFEETLMGERLVVVKIVGNAFLHSMVRSIVGTLVAVGRGRRDPEWVARVLAARDRKAAGENAPAKGLVLWKVDYDG